MFEFFWESHEQDAFAIIKADHHKVKALFEEFERAESKREKKQIAKEAIMELKIHAEIEEKLFYPTVRRDVEKDLMNEADEEHHVAKLLIAELDQMDGSEDHWEAKFTVLAENIRHHIREEEGEMLPQARQANVDFVTLGSQLMAMKEKLKKNGVPPSDEEKLMARRPLADSPARAARTKSAPKKARTGRKAEVRGATRKAAKPAANKAKTPAAAKRKTTRRGA